MKETKYRSFCVVLSIMTHQSIFQYLGTVVGDITFYSLFVMDCIMTEAADSDISQGSGFCFVEHCFVTFKGNFRTIMVLVNYE